GVHVGSETLRTHAEHLGTELEGQQQRAMAHVQVTQEPSPESPHEPAPGVLVVEADGVLVRYRDLGRDGSPWHELKLGIVGGLTRMRRDAHLEARPATSWRASRQRQSGPRFVAESRAACQEGAPVRTGGGHRKWSRDRLQVLSGA